MNDPESESADLTLITNGAQLQGSAMPGILANAQSILIGRKIVAVGYANESDDVWPCLVLDDGTTIMASQDDEGNGPGSLFVAAENNAATLCRTHLR